VAWLVNDGLAEAAATDPAHFATLATVLSRTRPPPPAS